ncbi:hypothetical protein Syun_009108 [Stephania yunnanensis]|uniref:Uncharacterized protein n=1 Tax=Stephania yunnanensis TaxID=152371 RepID=A0AAP0KFR5_9MAGN
MLVLENPAEGWSCHDIVGKGGGSLLASSLARGGGPPLLPEGSLLGGPIKRKGRPPPTHHNPRASTQGNDGGPKNIDKYANPHLPRSKSLFLKLPNFLSLVNEVMVVAMSSSEPTLKRVWSLPCWDLTETSKRDDGIDLLKDNQALQRLTGTAEKAKMDLSSLTQSNIRAVDPLSSVSNGINE